MKLRCHKFALVRFNLIASFSFAKRQRAVSIAGLHAHAKTARTEGFSEEVRGSHA